MSRVTSALKEKPTSFAVSMPLFGTSPEPSELTEDSSWYQGSGPVSNQRDSPSSVNNQVRLTNDYTCNPVERRKKLKSCMMGSVPLVFLFIQISSQVILSRAICQLVRRPSMCAFMALRSPFQYHLFFLILVSHQ